MKQNDQLYKTIIFVLQLVKEEGIEDIDYTALVKYVYLLDCFFAEENNGKQYTNVKWNFLNFGPYAFELEDIFNFEYKDSRFSIKKYSSKNFEENCSRFKYDGWQDDYILKDISINIINRLKTTIKEFSKLSLNELLHFIYFKTTPMINAKHKEILSFSGCKKINFMNTFKPKEEELLNKDKIKNALSFLESIDLGSLDDEDDSCWYDDLYYKNIHQAQPIYESDGVLTVDLPIINGIAKIIK